MGTEGRKPEVGMLGWGGGYIDTKQSVACQIGRHNSLTGGRLGGDEWGAEREGHEGSRGSPVCYLCTAGPTAISMNNRENSLLPITQFKSEGVAKCKSE